MSDKSIKYVNDPDVIVIGGGPSGSHTSLCLSRMGYQVLLFEKDEEIGKNVVCSGVLSKEAFDSYDLPYESVAATLGEADLYSPSGKHIRYVHPDNTVMVVDRCKFDQLLAKRAQDAGTTIRTGVRVVGIVTRDDCVEVITSAKKRQTTYRAKMAVIATGASFHLQKSLGLGNPEKMLKGIQVEFPSTGIERLKVFWGNTISKGFFGWTIPLDDGRIRIGVMSKEKPDKGLRNIISELKLDIGLDGDCPVVRKGGISYGKIGKTYANRVLVVGEAAGIVKTTTGGGIYYGLISAELASKVTAQAFRKGRYDEAFLSLYDYYLNREFSKEINLGKYFHNFYSNLSDREIDMLFDAAIKDDLLTHLSSEGRFDWHMGTVYRILRSPNLRKILFKGLVRRGTDKLLPDI